MTASTKHAACVSHTGGHEFNEDCARVLEREQDGVVFMVVCDGVTHGTCGGLASCEAVAAACWPATVGDEALLIAQSAVEQAQKAVLQVQGELRSTRIASTIVVAALRGNHAAIAWCGDSRGYLIRGGCIRQLTEDHAARVSDLIQAGRVSAERAAELHLGATVLTSALGFRFQNQSVEVEIQPGDQIVLCSDGLYNAVPADQIAAIVTHARSPVSACRQLIHLANAAHTADNATVAVMRCD